MSSYKHVLILGATSGIGKAMAEKWIANGSKVIVTGRRKEQLDSFVKENGSDKADSATFDITDLPAIPKFMDDMFEKHPDIDAIFLNSGIQRGMNWAKHQEIDLDVLDLEVKTNYTSYMYLTKAALPYLEKQAPKTTALIFTTSGLGLVPMPRAANYCATKAALHHMILSMRSQLQDAGSNVRIVELLPPAVQTELHDEKHQPDIKNGRAIGMPLNDFVEEAFEGLSKEGDAGDQVPVQMVKMNYNSWEMDRQKAFKGMLARMKGGP